MWMAEFEEGYLGKIDAKTLKVTWFPLPSPHGRARRMEIDDQPIKKSPAIQRGRTRDNGAGGGA